MREGVRGGGTLVTFGRAITLGAQGKAAARQLCIVMQHSLTPALLRLPCAGAPSALTCQRRPS